MAFVDHLPVVDTVAVTLDKTLCVLKEELLLLGSGQVLEPCRRVTADEVVLDRDVVVVFDFGRGPNPPVGW